MQLLLLLDKYMQLCYNNKDSDDYKWNCYELNIKIYNGDEQSYYYKGIFKRKIVKLYGLFLV